MSVSPIAQDVALSQGSPAEVTARGPAPAAPPAATFNPQSTVSSSPSASLYVGELDPTVTEAMLFEIFNMIGPVASIRVCRDAVTRRSLGYAYVNYLNTADGERALEQLNYSLIKGNQCRIMWSQRDPALRKTGQGNIFIKNLDEQIDNKALHDTFAAFGNVLSCKVGTDERGRSKGYGFVHYDTAEAAETAIKAVNGMLLNDRKVYVGHHISKKERQAKIDEQKKQFTNVYVKNLDPELSEEEFRNMFENFGPITSAVLQTDHEGNSKGFGFVNFENHEHAQIAVDSLNETELNGRKLFVARAQKKAEREEELRKVYEQAKMEKLSKYQGVNLYIKNLDDDIDDEKLRTEFEPFGTITSAKVMRDEKDHSKGFGFVCFSSPEEATKAVAEMNNKMIGNKPLYVSLAQRREVRKQQLESQIAQRDHIRMQQQQGQAIPGAYPMYFPPGPGGFPPARGMMGYAQPRMMPPRPQYPPGNHNQGPGIPLPYGPPQGYGGMPAYPPRGQPRPGPPSGAQPSRPGPPGPPRGGPPGPSVGGTRPKVPQPGGAPPIGQPPDVPPFNATALANAPPMEQKQMLGEILYMRIVPAQPELAGKITGMLLEMENPELLMLLDSPEALGSKVQEALAVLHEFSQKDETK